jgi:hypothetical protein
VHNAPFTAKRIPTKTAAKVFIYPLSRNFQCITTTKREKHRQQTKIFKNILLYLLLRNKKAGFPLKI